MQKTRHGERFTVGRKRRIDGQTTPGAQDLTSDPRCAGRGRATQMTLDAPSGGQILDNRHDATETLRAQAARQGTPVALCAGQRVSES